MKYPHALAFAVILALAGTASGREYKLTPREKMLPPGPGAELAAAHCAACHSLDYIATQPRRKGRQFWQDAVTKMITVHGAQIPEADRGAIVDYLDRTQ